MTFNSHQKLSNKWTIIISVQDIISVKDLHFTEDGCEVGEEV